MNCPEAKIRRGFASGSMTRSPLAKVLSAAWTTLVLVAGAQAHPAWGIAVDRQGHVYFSDLKMVWKIDAQGGLSVFRPGTGDRHVHDLNVDEAGNVYGADNSYDPATKRFFSAVWKMTPSGEFSYMLPTNGKSARGYEYLEGPQREYVPCHSPSEAACIEKK